VTIRAADLRGGDQLVLVVLTVASVMDLEGSIYVQFKENDRVEVFPPDHELKIIREG